MTDRPRRERFPIARRALRTGAKWRRNWLDRHQNSASYYLHLVGIPLTVLGLLSLFFLPWPLGVAAFVVGYLLQFVGHGLEGNDVGEVIPFKRLAGMKVTPISPKYPPSPRREPPLP